VNEHVRIPFLNWYLDAFYNQEGKLVLACRPIAEKIGLNWGSQHTKLTSDPKFSCLDISTTGADGKQYQMLCIPHNRVGAWLYSINSNKIREELRPALIQFQEMLSNHIHAFMNNTLTQEKFEAMEQTMRDLIRQLHILQSKVQLLEEENAELRRREADRDSREASYHGSELSRRKNRRAYETSI